MGEAKSFASLSSGLLARKGAAKPAMRRPVPSNHPAAHEHDDLGWNDMGYDVDPDQNAETEQSGHYRHNPLMGAIPETDPGSRARLEEMAERLNFHALPSDEELAAAAAEAESEVEAAHAGDPLDEMAEQTDGSVFESIENDPAADDIVTADDASIEEEPSQEEPAEDELAQDELAEAAPLLAVKPRSMERASQHILSKSKARLPKAKIAAKDKTAFTLRLDHDRHLQLRLACAVRNVSAQKLVTSALDELLATMPELGEVTRHLHERPS